MIRDMEDLVELRNEARTELHEAKADGDESMIDHYQGRLDHIEDIIEETNNAVYLVAEDEFIEHAQSFAEGTGAIEDAHRWPATHIDWDEAAADLRQDYTAIEIEGQTLYWR